MHIFVDPVTSVLPEPFSLTPRMCMIVSPSRVTHIAQWDYRDGKSSTRKLAFCVKAVFLTNSLWQRTDEVFRERKIVELCLLWREKFRKFRKYQFVFTIHWNYTCNPMQKLFIRDVIHCGFLFIDLNAIIQNIYVYFWNSRHVCKS